MGEGEKPSHKAGQERHSGIFPTGRTGREQEDGHFRLQVQVRQYGGINGKKTGMNGRGGSWSWGSGIRNLEEGTLTLARLARRHPRSSLSQSKSINESINHHQPTGQRTNQPTHHPSLVNPTGHRGTTCAARAMQHSAHLPAHVPVQAGTRAGTQSPAPICILSTIKPPQNLPLVRHTCQLGQPGRSLGLPRSRRCLASLALREPSALKLLRAGILPCEPASMQAPGQMALESF